MPGEFYEIGRRLLDVVHEGKDGELDARCPLHGDDNRPSLRFNSDTGLWYCHSCHEGGNANTLSIKLTGERVGRASFETTADILERELEAFGRAQARARSFITPREQTVSVIYRGKQLSVSTSGSTTTGRESSYGAESETNTETDGEFHFSPVTLQTRRSHRQKAEEIDYAALFGVAVSGQRDLVVEESVLSRYKAPTDYWETERRFDPDWSKVFELGYDAIEDAYTIPIRNEEGQLLGVNFRYNDGNAKYKLPAGFERKRHLFASWLHGKYGVDDPTTVVLVEGATDAIACWHVGYQAFAMYGSSLSDEQLRILHRMGIRNLIIATDDDEAGRDAARAIWKQVPRFFAGQVHWPRHPRQRHDGNARGYDPAELFAADPDSLARTLDRVRLT